MDTGLTSAQAAALLELDGPNRLPPPPRTPAWRMLLKQLVHFFALMLWAAAGLAVLGGMPGLGAAIALIVVLNGVFAFVQEHRADRAAEELRELMPAGAVVVRDGEPVTVAVTDLVRGDLVRLETGDRVPADLELTGSTELEVDESMLTGESVPVHTKAGRELLAGTFVVGGEGRGVVVRTGHRTRLAGVADLTAAATRPPSPLSRQLDRLVRVIAVVAVSVGSALAVVALLLGSGLTAALLFGVGVTVALVPEGLLPTVTLSLARGAQRMAREQALVRHLEAVQTLGDTTFICTDKTGTLTRNEMAVVEIWTPAGTVTPHGTGYEPGGRVEGPAAARELAAAATGAARVCVTGRAVSKDGRWVAQGDPMGAALDTAAHRLGAPDPPPGPVRLPFSSARLLSAAAYAGRVDVVGAPEVVLARCPGAGPAEAVLDRMADAGKRVLAVAELPGSPATTEALEGLVDSAPTWDLLALVAIEDPPREGVAEALSTCRRADIRVAMMTGDNARTAASIAATIGLLLPGGVVVEGRDLPGDDLALADLLDRPEGAVVARVTPEDKLRIAGALRRHGHVVAMTGDGVNDAPALRGADVGVAMGLGGSDVARQAADLVLLDDHFATIARAIGLGRATYANVRRFLTFHLTDNVAELTPFAVWALSGGSVPAAISVLQVLALDIGTDMLPALALGSEPANRRAMDGPRRYRNVVDGPLLRRAFLVLGPLEALVAMAGFLWVLRQGGWEVGGEPEAALLATASGTAFAAIAVGQVANSFACRSEHRPAWLLDPRTNPLLLLAVAVEVALLLVFVGVPWVADLLGGTWPSAGGWLWALAAAPTVVVGDALLKVVRRRRQHRPR